MTDLAEYFNALWIPVLLGILLFVVYKKTGRKWVLYISWSIFFVCGLALMINVFIKGM